MIYWDFVKRIVFNLINNLMFLDSLYVLNKILVFRFTFKNLLFTFF
jgi:hypothetical protein